MHTVEEILGKLLTLRLLVVFDLRKDGIGLDHSIDLQSSPYQSTDVVVTEFVPEVKQDVLVGVGF